jgi:violaxanthin de-epoxidase
MTIKIFSSHLIVIVIAVVASLIRNPNKCDAFSVVSFTTRNKINDVKRLGGSSRRISSILSTRKNSSPSEELLGELMLSSHQGNHIQTTRSSSLSCIILSPSAPVQAADSVAIAGCLLKQCRLPLAKCIANPKCLANVICINTCNGQPNETGCQIKCGDLFDNDVVGEFNKCAVSDRSCVPQRPDDGSYPVPPKELTVQKFDTKLFNGRW